MLDAFSCARAAKIGLWTAATLILAFLVAPTLIVIPISFSASDLLEFPPRAWSLRWYENFFGSATWMGALRVSLILGTLVGILFGHVVLAIPVPLFVLLPALRRFDWPQVDAARSLGAGWTRTIGGIVLPQLSFSLLSAAMMAFLTSLDEAVISIFVSSGANSTLPKIMFLSLRDQIDPTIAAISTLWVLMVAMVVLVLNRCESTN